VSRALIAGTCISEGARSCRCVRRPRGSDATDNFGSRLKMRHDTRCARFLANTDGTRPPLSLSTPLPAVGLGNNSIPSQLRLYVSSLWSGSTSACLPWRWSWELAGPNDHSCFLVPLDEIFSLAIEYFSFGANNDNFSNAL